MVLVEKKCKRHISMYSTYHLEGKEEFEAVRVTEMLHYPRIVGVMTKPHYIGPELADTQHV